MYENKEKYLMYLKKMRIISKRRRKKQNEEMY